MLDRQVSSDRSESPAARRASGTAPGVERTAAGTAGDAQAPAPTGPAVAASPTDRLEGVLARAAARRAGEATPPMDRPLLQRFYARPKGGGMPAWQPEPLDPTKWRDSGEWTTWWWIPYRIYEPVDLESSVTPNPPVGEPRQADANPSQMEDPRQADAKPPQVMEELPQMANQRTLTSGEHFNALADWRAAQAQAIADYVKKRNATPPPTATTSPPTATTPLPAAGGFDATAAQALLSAFAPGAATDAYAYLGGKVDEGALADSGFDWGNERHIALVQAALDAVHELARAAAARAAAANAEAVRLRNERFDPGNRDTWELNSLEFFNVVTEEDIKAAPDGPGILDTIRKATLRANGMGKRRIPISANARFHTHIASGSWGLSFIYIVERDMTVTPYVYDIAQSRLNNVYDWRNGSKSSGNSDAPLPTPKPA